ncbi:hypothetical protein HLB35_16125 [Halomonas sp. TBZ9]|uniref:Uncharacterized protein n=1 Tax=Vreelandella azerica TaxID=2732867 RepID=A0A7Y3TZ58_9GAMM|nr:hypothetical protein [Halomonas azerica]NOG32916.1 hypothetical protein [Halomonas azerica]
MSGATQQGLQNLVSDRDKQLERQREDYEQQIGYLRAQLEKAEERAQLAEKGKTQANTQVETLSAQIASLEAEKGKPRRKEEQPGLPFDGESST